MQKNYKDFIMIPFNVLLFDGFETLDVFGPVEIIGKIPKKYSIDFYSENGGEITSSQNVRINTLPADKIVDGGILLIPGGMGTRNLVNNVSFIETLCVLSSDANLVMTVCTGSALLAKTGLLKGKNATSNKMAFDWVKSIDTDVNWIRKARWVRDGKYYSSSGVSAGMDMTLGYVAETHGMKTAEDIARYIEYTWNKDCDNDPFSQINPL